MKIGTKLGLVAGGVLSIMLVVTAISHEAVGKLVQSSDDVEHSVRILRDLEVILVNLADAESQSRGYLLTGNESYLPAHRNAVAQIQPTMEDLRLLVAGNTSMLKQLDEVEGVINEKLSYLKEYVDLRRTSRQEEALKLFDTNKGRELMDQIRTSLRRLMDADMETFNQTRADAHDIAESMLHILALSCVLSFLFVIALAIFFTQDLTGSIRRLIRSADRISSGKYEFIPAASATDEFSELAVAFNQVSNSLRSAMETAAEERKTRDEALELLESVRRYVEKMVTTSSHWLNATLDHRKELEQHSLLAKDLVLQTGGQTESSEQLKQASLRLLDLSQLKVLARENELKLADEIHTLVTTIVDKTQSASHGVTSLTDRIEEMSEIVATMDNIASGSNLIALSAAIESTRDGSGFQALIGELKSISESSKQDSVKSRQILSHVQSTASRAILDSQDATRTIDMAVKKLDHVNEKLEKLMEPLEEAHKAAADMVELTTKHALVAGAVRHSVEQLQLKLSEEELFRHQAIATAETFAEIAASLKESVRSGQLTGIYSKIKVSSE